MVCDDMLMEPSQCTVEIHAALNGKCIASLKVDGETTVGSLRSKMVMSIDKASQKLNLDSPTKFMNQKGVLLDEDDKVEAINSKRLSQQPSSGHAMDGGKAVQVFTVAVLSEDKSSAAASAVKLIRSHSEFKCINHVAQGDDRGGCGNRRSHQIQQGTCLLAVLRKVHSPARAMVVQELLKRHPFDRSRDVQVSEGDSLAALAEDNGYPASIVASIKRRGEEVPRLVAKKPATARASARVRQPAHNPRKVKASITKKPARSTRDAGKR